MNDNRDKNLLEISYTLWKIKSENDIITLLSGAIKYISDTLLKNEEKITSQDQLKIDLLLEKLKNIKWVFQKYAEFFTKNKSEIKELIQSKESIVLLHDKTYISSDIIELTDYFCKLEKDLLEVLAYTETFFAINNFSNDDKNSFVSLLDMIWKWKTKSEKIMTLKNELSNIEWFISRLELRFKKFESFIPDLHLEVEKINKIIIKLFSSTINDFFWKVNTWNIIFKFRDNFLFTLFMEEIFNKIPKDTYSIKWFLKNLLEIGASENYKMIREKNIVSLWNYENMLQIFVLYSKLYDLHFWLQSEIISLKSELSQINSWSIFLSPKDWNIDEWKKLTVFSQGKQKFLYELKSLLHNFGHVFDDIKIEKTSIWNPELLKIKKEIFNKLFEILELISILDQESLTLFTAELDCIQIDEKEKNVWKKKKQDETQVEKIIKLVFDVMKLYKKFITDKKNLNNLWSWDYIDGKKSSFHYKPVLDSHWIIESFEEVKTDEIVAMTIWKTADEIRWMINGILSRDKFHNILWSFPGWNGSLEWNYIILWPWGWWKTALIKELSQNPKIATIEIGKSDIVDMYVWATEKNVKAIYENAYKIHLQTKKHVFVFIDEVDAILWKITTIWWWSIDVQKEIQTMLDGVKSYPWVHTIMLSNVPHKIPIDIYRRMEKTFVLKDLDLSEKVELIHTRIGRYPLSKELSEFLNYIKSIFPNLDFVLNSNMEIEFLDEILETHDFELIKKLTLKDRDILIDLYIDKKLCVTDKKLKENIKRLYFITPKILWQVTERLFKNFILKFDSKTLEKLNMSLGKLKDKSNSKKVREIFSKHPHEITLHDFFEASEQVFSNASTKSEIEWNMRFYETVDQMMKMISSWAFDWVRWNDHTSKAVLNIQIIEE